MCGRYASFLPAEAVARLFHSVNPIPNFPPTWNMAPTQDAMIVRRHPETGERHLDLLKWGLLPYFTKDPTRAKRPINARAETVMTSGMFRSAFSRRRCIVPADAFYEWKVIKAASSPTPSLGRMVSQWPSQGYGKGSSGRAERFCEPSPSSPRTPMR
jgi:putative SOS response-associated peptidase YedK